MVEDLLSRPPDEAARRIALAHLAAAGGACECLSADGDDEALHDFRVALRRLRSTVRAYPDLLAAAVGKKDLRRLRRLVRATGSGRDAEVAQAWLAARRRELDSRRRRGLDWALARLEARVETAYGDIRGEVVSSFGDLEGDLRRRLAVYTAEVRLEEGSGPQSTFGGRLAAEAERHGASLVDLLARVDGADDAAGAHRARIEAKRLRYLLEPAVRESPAAEGLVRRLKSLQDLLGELHDAHVLEVELAGWMDVAAAERARGLLAEALAAPAVGRGGRGWDVVQGLLALARLNRGRRDGLFGELAEAWLSAAGLEGLGVEVAGAAAEAAGGGVRADPAAEPDASSRGPAP